MAEIHEIQQTLYLEKTHSANTSLRQTLSSRLPPPRTLILKSSVLTTAGANRKRVLIAVSVGLFSNLAGTNPVTYAPLSRRFGTNPSES